MSQSETRARPESQTSHGLASAPLEAPTVLQVLPGMGHGGAERSALDVSVALARAGGRALVASKGGPLVRLLERDGGRHVVLPMASKNPITMWRNVDRLAELIRREGVDIVHARSRAPAWSARAAARRCGIHFVTTFHGTYNFTGGVKRAYNAIMTKGERVIANSTFIAEHIRQHYQIDPGIIRVIPRGVDLERFDPARVPAARTAQLAMAWRLPDDRPLILLPGRLTRWKGQGLLLEALARLSDLSFWCALVGTAEGNEDYRAELERSIRRLGLESSVFILDHCDDMPAAYMLADVVVSASTDPEAFGRVIGEAQAMGCPVVAADHGGAPEQVVRDKTAFLVPPSDADALAAGLRRALALTTSEREALAAQAIAYTRTHFSKEQMCERTLDVYDEIRRGDG